MIKMSVSHNGNRSKRW